ncbi:MAG: phosphatase PAP2 family protein [Chloroflexi bacterium]|nr:phosphatase PAP2 family protein [Chloroflexota bacterium]
MQHAVAAPVTRRLSPLRLSRRHALEIAALLALLTAVAFSTFNALTTDRAPFDLPLTRQLQRIELGPFGQAIFGVGLRGVAGALVVIVAAWLWLRRRRVEAVMVALLLVASSSSFVLRALYDRPRPAIDLVTVHGGPQGAGYPSGTALHYMLFGGFMVYLLPKVVASRRWVAIARCCTILMVIVIGAWLVHEGRHWPSDVIGGYLYGLIFLAVFVKAYPVAKRLEAPIVSVVNRMSARLPHPVGVTGRSPLRPDVDQPATARR